MHADAVFFDAGNTLIYPDPPVGEVYARALCAAGIDADPARMEECFREAWVRLRRERIGAGLEYGGTDDEARKWWREVAWESFRPFGHPEAFDQVFGSLWNHFANEGAWGIFDDVWPTFRELRRRGIGIGLISNWDSRLEPVLAGLGLSEEFDWIIVSCHIGIEKPDSRIFHRARELCGVEARRLVHVGDSLADDVLGAQAAGMHAIWLRREDGHAPAAEGLTVVATLTEVPRLVYQDPTG
jgi:putative hydrolase of the HAD superfamily